MGNATKLSEARPSRNVTCKKEGLNNTANILKRKNEWTNMKKTETANHKLWLLKTC